MKYKFLFFSVLISFLISSVSVLADYQNYFTEDFTDLSNWEYIEKNWVEQPKIENGKLVLNFAGLRNKAQSITRKFPAEIALNGTSNLTVKLDVDFSDTVPVAANFPTITGISCSGRILKKNDKSTYEVMLGSKKYEVGEILPNHSYGMQYVINIKEDTLKVCLTDKSAEGDNVKIITITDCGFNGTQALKEISLFAYCTDVNYPALVNVTALSVFNDEFSVVSSSIDDGKVNVRADSDCILEFSKEVYLDSAKNGISLLDADGNQILTDISYADSTKTKLLIKFPVGLEYNQQYSLKLSKGISDTDGNSLEDCVYNFKTELAPFSIGNVSLDDSDGKIKASAEVYNFSGREREINIFVLIYDDNKLVGGKAARHYIADRESDKKISVEMDIPDISKTYTKKVFLWETLKSPKYIKSDF